jgi:hypothetical protein
MAFEARDTIFLRVVISFVLELGMVLDGELRVGDVVNRNQEL